MHHRLKVSTEMPSFSFVSLNPPLYLITFWVYLKFLWSRLSGARTAGMRISTGRDAEFTDLLEWPPWSLWACHTRQQTTIPDPLCTRENVEMWRAHSVKAWAIIQPSTHMWSTDVAGIVWKFSWHVFKTLCRVQSVLDGSARFDRRKTV